MNWLGVAGAALLVVGAALFGGGVYATFQQEGSLSDLQSVEGTVVAAELEPADGSEFYPNVTYRYSVNGTNYTSNEIFPDQGRKPMERDDATEVLGRYAAGDTVEVYLLDVGENGRHRPSLRAPRSPVPLFAVGFGFVSLAFGFLLAVAGRQGGVDPIETDEVTLPGTEPTPRSDGNDEGDESVESSDDEDDGEDRDDR